MALNDVTISLDLNQLLGGDIDTRRTRVYVKTNVTNNTLIDTSTGETRLGDERVLLEADGTGSFTTWGVGADGNPTSWQTSVVVEYPRAGSRDRVTRTFGPYTITDADNGRTLAELEDQQAIPPNYQTAFVADMEAIRDEAEAARDAAVDISNIDTSDGVVSTLIEGTAGAGPLTRSALSASIDRHLRGGTYAHSGFAWYAGGASTPDTYQAVNRFGVDAGLLASGSNTGYARQREGTPAHHAAQSRMRRCILKDDGTGVLYYLDCDDSTKIAGSWDGTVQTGWVRVYEGALDPNKTTPGQSASVDTTLRAGIPTWSATVTYSRGSRVIHGGSIWDSLSDANLNITPAGGAATADLSGAVGQVMVEIPAFYYRMDYDPARRRHTYEIVFDPTTYKPFPDLTTGATISETLGGFDLHPAFTRGGAKRAARYHSAFHASASDTGDNGVGVLKSVCNGVVTNSTNISATNFRTKARNRNAGLSDPSGQANNVWSLCDYWTRHALNLLFVTEYRTHYSQAVVGGGNISGADFQKVAGRSVPMGNSSGVFNGSGVAQPPSAAGDFSGMTYRGIEDLWGSAWQWMDGWNVRNQAATEHWVCNNPHQYAYGTATNYALAASALKGIDNWQYPTDLVGGTFLGSAAGASTSTHLTDGYFANADVSGEWRVPRMGASADNGGPAGVAAFGGLDQGGGFGDIGAGLVR